MQTLNPACPAGTQNRVSIIGAGKVGSTLAHGIISRNLADVVLLDIQDGLPQGIALDLMEARGLEGHDRQIIGTSDYADTANSDVVVITAGRARLPGMSRDDLIETNAKIVIEAAKKAIAHSPNAVLIVVTNPLDVMTHLAWEATGLPARRVVGMAGVLDASRLQVFIAAELGVSARDVQTMVLGNHGNMMVPLPRYCTVGGIPITKLMDDEKIDRLVQRTRQGGTEIVELMKTGGAYYAPAASTCLMVESILLNQFRLVSAAVYLQGEYGIKDVFLGVCCRLSGQGVEQIFELDLTEKEHEALQAAADLVRQNVDRAKLIFPNAAL
ncbi:MAG TPA: malate dehydrogenase [Oscillatoriales cyanobacterium M59_W2019_021]|nr:malate dehydrogenase [Oscillatoriales cyanobacterium M4454_W2019_049]HIK50412.1 malate dehydrogenase [Oscillatoriales cyanobacterium M59_W2019_021]